MSEQCAQPDLRFEFGRNWSQFVRRNLNQECIDIARNHILAFVKRADLKGLDFLDIGSGSGINSAAASSADANQICSFDYDPHSVAATRAVRMWLGNARNWKVMRGDILDDGFISSLGTWSFVYSWGVLHHTGNVWRAIDNASRLVADNGLFYVALYSADVVPDPEFWLRIKREYNLASRWKKQRMVWWYIWNFMMGRRLRRLPELLVRAAQYRRTQRGMSLFVNVRDWLGGWPMEFTRDADVVEFLKNRGFILQNIGTGEANTEFLFVKCA